MAVHKIPTFRLVCGMAILNWIAYFVVIIVKILNIIYFVLSLGIVHYVENLSRSVNHTWNLYSKLFTIICFTDLQNGAAMFSIIPLIQQSNNHQFISSCFLCLYQILRFSSGLVNKIHGWEARKRSKVKPQSKWPIFWMTLWVAIVYCIEFIPHLVYGFQKKFIFFVNCVYCQR